MKYSSLILYLSVNCLWQQVSKLLHYKMNRFCCINYKFIIAVNFTIPFNYGTEASQDIVKKKNLLPLPATEFFNHPACSQFAILT
jgi:hypothetical protein